MAVGEKSFSSKGKKVERFDDSPCPPGGWPLKLRGDKAEIRKGNDSGLPYINVPFEAVGSGEGGRDKWVFHMFHLSLKPGKDGKVMAERQDGLVALAKAFGEDFDLPTATVTDAQGNKVTVISAMPALKYLQNHDGETVNGQTKIEKGKGEYGDRARISYFEEAEASSSPDEEAGPDEEAPAEEEAIAEEEAPAEEEQVEEEQPEEEPEPEPVKPKTQPKPAAKKPAPPPAKKPNKR